MSDQIRPQTGRIRDTQTMQRAMGVRRELKRVRTEAFSARLRADGLEVELKALRQRAEAAEAQVAALSAALMSALLALVPPTGPRVEDTVCRCTCCGQVGKGRAGVEHAKDCVVPRLLAALAALEATDGD